ncbi:hypothetical protein RHGRI_034183 [Rhododendron griersonianum]|uniref:BAH domain-containing protein n=1 Tax=Rhododendron griersonianum TaxID=479676 RepID=A0AAV6I566_9ERIC|nr:hypothetical protein RHGRI_034183 [Rhododendron griersonianum]
MTAPRGRPFDIALHPEYKSSKVISDFSSTSASSSALFELASLIEGASLSAFELSGATSANKEIATGSPESLKVDSDASLISNASSNSSLEEADVDEMSEMTLPDLYFRCRAMSTGLSLRTVISGVKLVTIYYEVEKLLSICCGDPNEIKKTGLYFEAEEGKPDYIAKIVELFETINGELYFSAQWFYRAVDTVR